MRAWCFNFTLFDTRLLLISNDVTFYSTLDAADTKKSEISWGFALMKNKSCHQCRCHGFIVSRRCLIHSSPLLVFVDRRTATKEFSWQDWYHRILAFWDYQTQSVLYPGTSHLFKAMVKPNSRAVCNERFVVVQRCFYFPRFIIHKICSYVK
jgi:hypothetical protein